MKRFFILVILALNLILNLSLESFGQSVLIPYKSGDKFGLCDSNARVVLAPVYDMVEHFQQDYFIFGNKEMRMDTIIDWRDDTSVLEIAHWSKGLLKRNEVLIAPGEWERFHIFDHFIAVGDRAYEDPYQPVNVFLYNLKGEKVSNDQFRTIYINEERDLGPLANVSERYTLLSLFHRTEMYEGPFTLDGPFSLAVYDNFEQKIGAWLVREVENFAYMPDKSGKDFIYVTFYNKGQEEERHIRFVNGAFEIFDPWQQTLEVPEPIVWEGQYMEKIVEEEETFEEEVIQESAPAQPIYATPGPVPALPKYFERIHDSLFFFSEGKGSWVQTPKNTEIMHAHVRQKLYYGAIIYRQGAKYGLLSGGVFTKKQYDSLLYFGNHFIVGKKAKRGMKFGVIDAGGNQVVPMVYDSIDGNMKKYKGKHDYSTGKAIYTVELQEEYYGEGYTDFFRRMAFVFVVYKGRKCGLLTLSNTLILPIEYDTIAPNGLNFSYPEEAYFILLKKDGLYGYTHMSPDFDEKTWVLNNTTMPRFKYLPAFYRDDYYTPGFRLVALYRESDYRFMGYANENGLLYFKPE